jgi:hypothetical protein
MTLVEYRLSLHGAGYVPVPCKGKVPPLKEFTTLAIDAAEIRSWSRRFPFAANTGLLTALAPAIDFDITNPEAAAAVERLVRERYEERGYILVRFGRKPKRAILFRTNTPFSKITRKLVAPDGSEQRVEFLGDGQQLIVRGVHPETHQPYAWFGGEPGEVASGDLPYISAEEAATLADDCARLLIEAHGYQLSVSSSGDGAGEPGDKSWARDWAQLFADLHAGKSVHDSSFGLAVRLIKSGATDEDAVDIIQGALDASAIERESTAGRARFQKRRCNVKNIVAWARKHFDGPVASIDLSGPVGWPAEEEVEDADTVAETKVKAQQPEPDDTSPLPLYPPLLPQRPYPTRALGALAEGAAAVARQTQAAPSIAGNAVLAVASLVTQALADAILPIGRGKARPLSLYFVTVAESGDRKTSADDEALRPVRQHERELKTTYEGDLASWRIAHRAWAGHVRSLDGKRNLSLAERAHAYGRAGCCGACGSPMSSSSTCMAAGSPCISWSSRKSLCPSSATGCSATKGSFRGFSSVRRLRSPARA